MENYQLSKEKLINLARTNYFLAEIRKKLQVNGEVYTKWFMVGNLNGAFFVGDTVEYHADFYFSEKEFNASIAKLGNIWFSYPNESKYKIDFENEARKINEDFDELWKIKGDSILFQVSRFLMYTGFHKKEENPVKVKDFINRVYGEFPNSKIHQVEQVLPFSEPFGIQYDFDVEIVLDEPISNNEFIIKLKKHIPNFREPIFGYGFMERNPVQDIEFGITLYARQF